MEVRMKCRGVCAFLAGKGRATNYIICVFERQPGRSHVWPGGCRRRDPSSCLRAVKWSRWRAAEEDIIQRLIILSGSRRALCFAGCRRWRGGGTPAKHQVSQSAPMNGQWPSINLPCQLVSRPGTNYNVHLKAIWSLQLTHSSAWPHLQSGPVS